MESYIKTHDQVLPTADIAFENLLFQVLKHIAHNYFQDYAQYNFDDNLLLSRIYVNGITCVAIGFLYFPAIDFISFSIACFSASFL